MNRRIDLRIRHVEARDSVALQELHGLREAYFGTLQLPYPAEDDWKQRLENIPPGSKTLVAEIDGKVIGQAGITYLAKSPRRRHVGELGMAVHTEWRRKGVGSALLEALVDLADNWINVTRLELRVFTDNDAAIALYKKFGFEVEGTHREFAFRNGEYADVYSMARIKQTHRCQ